MFLSSIFPDQCTGVRNKSICDQAGVTLISDGLSGAEPLFAEAGVGGSSADIVGIAL